MVTANRVTMTVDDLQVSRFVAGFMRQSQWNLSDAELQKYVEDLLELGITTMDHAFVYRSEQQFGRVLRQAPHLRDRMEIVSKFGIRPAGFGDLGAVRTNHYDSSAGYLNRSVEATLTDLGTGYLDLLLVHRPDYLMQADELASAFSELRAQGMVRHFGVSNFSPSQFDCLQAACDFPLVTNQVEFSPLYLDPLDNGLFDQCLMLGISPMLWSCLGGGRLFTGEDEQSVRIRGVLQKIAEELGCEAIDTVIYSWVLRLPCQPLPVIGTQRLDRVRGALAAQNLELSREQWYSVWEASVGHTVP